MKKQRILFLDLARGLAIFFMIMQHAVIIYAVNAGEGSDLGDIVLLLGTAPAAPVFMLIMGIFFAHSRKTMSLRFGVTQGLRLLLLGYLLNLIRFSLPTQITGEYGIMFKGSESPLALFFVVDILQMAGLSLIVMTLIKRYLSWRIVWLSAAVVIGFVSPLLWGILDELPGLSLLWGTGENVFFPLFPWIIYPLIGMVYSYHLIGCGDMSSLMKKTSLVGLCLFVAGALSWIFLSNDIFVVGDYFRSGPWVHLTIIGFVFLWLPFCWWIVERVPGNPIFRQLYFWSTNVTVAYIIQWTLIGWGMLFFGCNELSALIAVLIGIVLLPLTHLLTKLYLYYRRKPESVKSTERAGG